MFCSCAGCFRRGGGGKERKKGKGKGLVNDPPSRTYVCVNTNPQRRPALFTGRECERLCSAAAPFVFGRGGEGTRKEKQEKGKGSLTTRTYVCVNTNPQRRPALFTGRECGRYVLPERSGRKKKNPNSFCLIFFLREFTSALIREQCARVVEINMQDERQRDMQL